MNWRNWRWWLGLNPKFPDFPGHITVSVIIPALNEEKCIGTTLQSVLNQTYALDQIIVVDDASTDRTGDIARSFEGVTVIRPESNSGSKPRAQNLALDHVTSEVFVTVDADTILAPDAIEQIMPYFQDEEIVSACGFVIPQRIETIWERGRFMEYLFGITLQKGAQNQIGAVMISCGCFSAFRTDPVREVGGFPPGTIAEDMDLTWELSTRGKKVTFHNTAYCYPVEPPNFRLFVAQIDRWYRGFFQNILKHNFRGRRRLGALVYWYVIDATIVPIMFFGFILWRIHEVPYAIVGGILADIVVSITIMLLKAARIKKFRLALTSIPAYFFLRPINLFVFWRSLWRECIKRDPLTIWVKGH